MRPSPLDDCGKRLKPMLAWYLPLLTIVVPLQKRQSIVYSFRRQSVVSSLTALDSVTGLASSDRLGPPDTAFTFAKFLRLFWYLRRSSLAVGFL